MHFVFDPRGHQAIRQYVVARGGTCLVETLGYGDVAMLGHNNLTVGIEIKEADDLLASMRSGRLFEQVSGMIGFYDQPILLVYGYLSWHNDGTLRTKVGLRESPPWPNYTSLMGAMLSLGACGVLTPPWQRDEGDAAEMICRIYTWFNKEEHHSLTKRARPFMFGNAESLRAMHIVTGIPRVDAGIARRLLTHFGTPLAVLSASEQELLAVKGIGPKLAHIIYEAARAQFGGNNV